MDMKRIVNEYFNAFERKDGKAWVGLFAEGASLGGPAHTPPVMGHAALAELFAGIAMLFETIQFEVLAVHAHGSFAVAEFHLHTRARNGRTPQAKGMVAFAADASGKLTQVAGFWDPVPVFSQAMAA